ncbi:MAG TPA: hypothetical protein VEJ84_01285 [Acidimicrobiales bacterium]|nr:hypothetical protein [Acidimicrobiales bacterium]
MKPATGQDESAGGPVPHLADHAQGNDDEMLLAELRRAVAVFDPLPASTADFGLDVLSWRDPDAELAALVADSRELAGAVRSGNREVLLRFEVAPYAITLEASPDAGGRFRVVGQVEPGIAGRVDIRQSDGAPGQRELSVRCDEWGRFEAYPVAAGPVSLRLTPDKGHAVRTTWVVL